ncbi:MAG: peptidoglycan DD-metalloendopeptidase family protein [Oscillospiraceae bacterium]|nr:peptidoglycan DD-metalloendopeptidase family protein [Oscillospiraceae bacterium]
MENKWKSILGGAGFYVTMAVCLLVVGVSGYFLLFDGKETPAPEAEPPAQAPVTAPAPEIEEPEKPAVVETIAPEPVAETPPMPEVEIDDTPVVAEAPRLVVSPLQGEVLTAFSVDQLVYNATLEDWRTHDGVDISAEPGTSVLAACSGTVASVADDALMGTTVTIRHDGGYQTTYANLQAEPAVEKGDVVSAGQIIGAVGDTAAAEAAQGPHLHFSVTKDGDAVDPDEFLNR